MSKNYITIIHYKPSGESYSMGCLMDSWGSDLTINIVDTIELAAKDVKHSLRSNKNDVEDYEPEWSVALIINGVFINIIGDIDCDGDMSYVFDNDELEIEAGEKAAEILKLAKSMLKEEEAEKKRIEADKRLKKKIEKAVKRQKESAEKAEIEAQKLNELKKTLGVCAP